MLAEASHELADGDNITTAIIRHKQRGVNASNSDILA